MKVKQIQWVAGKTWQEKKGSEKVEKPQLILFFTTLPEKDIKDCCKDLENLHPGTPIVGCTSAGEIYHDDVYENTFSASAIEFSESVSVVEVASVRLDDCAQDSFKAGKNAASSLSKKELQGVIVISDGLRVNGSELVRGIRNVIGEKVALSGGLAGDAGKFEKTLVSVNGRTESGQIALIGLYGKAISIGHGSVGGWDEFGPVRKITRSEGNVLTELDGEPALDLYKKYLGDEHSGKLPGSALLFPILVYPENEKNKGLVRTVLAVDESKKTMTFAGDIPSGYNAQLMRANFDHIIDAAGEAAKFAKVANQNESCFALLISCVGRKMILGQRTADEIESVQDILGEKAHQLGFYSYGEISPIVNIKDSCALHNQTMTVTVISEKKAS